MNLVLTKKAFRSILKECRSFCQVETGGILVGKRLNEQSIIVPFTIGSGPKAKRSIVRYSPDVDWQQQSLENLFDRYQVNYVGSFHRHPGLFNYPSSVDYRTAQQIIFSPDWGVSEVIFPIIIFRGKEMGFYPYYLSRTVKEFQPMSWQIVSFKDQLVRDALRRRN